MLYDRGASSSIPGNTFHLWVVIADGLFLLNILNDVALVFVVNMIQNTNMVLAESAILTELPPSMVLVTARVRGWV